MIRITPNGWTDTEQVSRIGREFLEEGTDIVVRYLPVMNPWLPGTQWRRVLTMYGEPTDENCARALAAFDMVGAVELPADSTRVFEVVPK